MNKNHGTFVDRLRKGVGERKGVSRCNPTARKEHLLVLLLLASVRCTDLKTNRIIIYSFKYSFCGPKRSGFVSEVSYVVITLNNFISCTGTVLRSNFYEMAECVSFLGLFLNFFSKPTGVVSKNKTKQNK